MNDSKTLVPISTPGMAVADAVASVNLLTAGLAPAMALGSQLQQGSLAAGLSMLNAVSAQQSFYITSMAACVRGVQQLYGPAPQQPARPRKRRRR